MIYNSFVIITLASKIKISKWYILVLFRIRSILQVGIDVISYSSFPSLSLPIAILHYIPLFRGLINALPQSLTTHDLL